MLALAGKRVAQLHRTHLGAHLAAAAFVSSSPFLTLDSPPAHPRRVSECASHHVFFVCLDAARVSTGLSASSFVDTPRGLEICPFLVSFLLRTKEGCINGQHPLFPSVLLVGRQLSSLARTSGRVDRLHEQAFIWPVTQPPTTFTCDTCLLYHYSQAQLCLQHCLSTVDLAYRLGEARAWEQKAYLPLQLRLALLPACSLHPLCLLPLPLTQCTLDSHLLW